MDFKVLDTESRHTIYFEDEKGNRMGEVFIDKLPGNVYDISRTYVHPSLNGQGLAGQLVERAVKYIDEKGGTIQTGCSYAERWVEKHR